jgi:DNA-binding NarL/FixJ family response regulator
MNRSGSLARQVPILLRSRGQDRAIAGWIIDVPPSGVGALTRGFQSSTPAAIVARRLRERGVKKLPRGPRPTTQSNPGNLTSRELGVLGLVAQRLPNAQIAG